MFKLNFDCVNLMRSSRRRLGTTMIEVLFAVALFAGITTALMTVWLTHYHAIDQAQNLLAATGIADGLLAQQAGLAFKAKNDAGTTTIKRSVDGVPTIYEYRWEIVVTDTTVASTGLASPDIKNVSVTVKWTENNQEKSLTMVTCVYWQG